MQIIRLTDPNALPDGVPAVSTTRVPYRRLRGNYVAGTRYAEGDEVIMPSGYWYLSLENDNLEEPSSTSTKWVVCNLESEDWKANHEWDGTSLRWQNPDGSWGSLVDLEGPQAPQVQYQYSSDGETEWADTWTNEKWLRISLDGGDTWSDAMKYIGDDGEVAGPETSTIGNFASFAATDGNSIEDSGSKAADFATASHNHDGDYSAIDHNHDEDYSSIGHNHDATYSAVDHNHDLTYSAIDHNHDSDYAPLADYAPLNGWESFGNVTTTSTTTFNVTDNSESQAIFKPGRPLKVGSTYQLVTDYTTGTVTVAGGTLSDSTEYAISYGDFTRVQKIDINLSGAFAADATTTAIKSQTGDPLYWDLGPGVLCVVKHIIQTEDSAATTTQPAINIFAGTPTASTTCSGSGTTYALDTLVLSDTLAVLDGSTPVTAYTLDPVTGSLELDESPSGTVTASYDKWVAGDTLLSSDDETDTSRQTATGNLDVAYGERVELKVVKATGGTPGDDAEDLSVSLLFVLK